MEKEDYLDPSCPLCGKPGEPEPAQPIPVQRVLEKLDEYEMADDSAGAERHLRYWLTEAEMNRDLRGQLTLNNELIGHYRMSGDGEKSLAHGDRALALLEELDAGDTVTAGTVYVNVGTANVAFGRPEEGYRYFEKARANYERNLPETDPRLGGLYNNMGLCLTSLGRTAEARDLFGRALEVMGRKEHGELEQAITLLNLADAVAAEKSAEDAEAEIGELLDRASALLDTPDLPRDGYYAFVCDKCAPVFGHYGYFLEENELRKRVSEIRG